MSELTLIDQLLADQSELQTPAALASEHYDRAPDLAENFQSLIPLSQPGKGEQYAFQVELDKCTGCKACVAACHSLNGLDEDESWRDVGAYALSGKGGNTPGITQTVTTACHHCESPECMHGCPVGAYDKDAETGIVRHLDDQCIGCSYCILKCPFDVPKYNEERGIVRKCDMCHDRLAEGEAPACVQACPTEAIKIINVTANSGREASNFKLNTSNSSLFTNLNRHTRPTTRYINAPAEGLMNQPPPLKPEHAHAPLIFMLTLSQVGVGLLLLSVFLDEKFIPSLVGTLFVFLGLGIGALHLGQPLKVWRFFIGLRTSWLSREFAVFGALTTAAPALVALSSPWLPEFSAKSLLIEISAYSTALLGLAAVFTSVMLYADTRRALWSLPRSAFRFYTTVTASTAIGATFFTENFWVGLIGAMTLLTKITVEKLFVTKNKDVAWSPDQHTASLIQGSLRKVNLARQIIAAFTIMMIFVSPLTALFTLLVTECLERTLFFRSVYAPRMV